MEWCSLDRFGGKSIEDVIRYSCRRAAAGGCVCHSMVVDSALEVVGENECPSARGARRPANRDRIGESGVGGVLEVVGGSVSGRADWRLELEDFEVFNWSPFCWRTTKDVLYRPSLL